MSDLQVAVVWNPVKVDDLDQLTEDICARCAELGIDEPLWLETTEEDTGAGMAAKAVGDGATLVIVCGGDGTVAACAGALANSGVAMAVLPAGTGNLLARNLDLPLDRSAALDLAFGSARHPIDVLEADGRRFVVMAGMGFDAALIRDTDEALKGRIGWPAYLGGAARALRRSPQVMFEIVVDAEPPVRRPGIGVLVGNVGKLQGGLTLLPDALPDNGLLDVILLKPRGAGGWLTLVWHGLLRRTDSGRQAEIWRGGRVRISADRDVPLEFDGDHEGECRELEVFVLPNALVLCCEEV